MKKANYDDNVILSTTGRALHHVYYRLDEYSLISLCDREEPTYSFKPTFYCSFTQSAQVIIGMVTDAIIKSGQTGIFRFPGIKLRNKIRNIVFRKKAHKRTMLKLSKE